MADEKINVELFGRFVPDESTPADAYEGGSRPEHAGKYVLGVLVEGVEVVLAEVKGGHLGPLIEDARRSQSRQASESSGAQAAQSGEQATSGTTATSSEGGTFTPPAQG